MIPSLRHQGPPTQNNQPHPDQWDPRVTLREYRLNLQESWPAVAKDLAAASNPEDGRPVSWLPPGSRPLDQRTTDRIMNAHIDCVQDMDPQEQRLMHRHASRALCNRTTHLLDRFHDPDLDPASRLREDTRALAPNGLLLQPLSFRLSHALEETRQAIEQALAQQDPQAFHRHTGQLRHIDQEAQQARAEVEDDYGTGWDQELDLPRPQPAIDARTIQERNLAAVAAFLDHLAQQDPGLLRHLDQLAAQPRRRPPDHGEDPPEGPQGTDPDVLDTIYRSAQAAIPRNDTGAARHLGRQAADLVTHGIALAIDRLQAGCDGDSQLLPQNTPDPDSRTQMLLLAAYDAEIRLRELREDIIHSVTTASRHCFHQLAQQTLRIHQDLDSLLDGEQEPHFLNPALDLLYHQARESRGANLANSLQEFITTIHPQLRQPAGNGHQPTSTPAVQQDCLRWAQALDRLDHQVLLTELDQRGLPPGALAYLSERPTEPVV
jgi:hypothetical protein